MVASSTESMKKFAKDMSKQQQLYVYAMPPPSPAALPLSLLFGFPSLPPPGAPMLSSRIRFCARSVLSLSSV
jgi:hypothetical protein